MAALMRERVPPLLQQLLHDNFGALAQIFTAALLQASPCQSALTSATIR